MCPLITFLLSGMAEYFMVTVAGSFLFPADERHEL